MRKTPFKMILACLLGLIIFTTTFSNAFDEPGKPGTPEVTDWDHDYIEIKWGEPTSDGGSPILYYIIESRDKYSPEWTTAMKVPSNRKTAIFLGITGNEVQYRVIAVNAAGPSVPSEPSEWIMFRPR